jgi:hypothetical protein
MIVMIGNMCDSVIVITVNMIGYDVIVAVLARVRLGLGLRLGLALKGRIGAVFFTSFGF